MKSLSSKTFLDLKRILKFGLDGVGHFSDGFDFFQASLDVIRDLGIRSEQVPNTFVFITHI